MGNMKKAGAGGAHLLRMIGRLFCHQRRLAKLMQRALWHMLQGAQNAHCYDMDRNGEAWLIRRLAPSLDGRAVLDIGANYGEWSAQLREAAPSARVYAIEMIPQFAERLRERFADAVTVIQCGISDASGEISAYMVGGGGRILPGKTSKNVTAVPVRLCTGDDIVAETGIGEVALIKIDVEGYDIPALRGLRETIGRSRPVIQFEYSRFYIESRHFLRDAYDLLEPLDYRIGRLMPRRIDYLPYHRSLENFLPNNYVAVPKELQL